MLNILLCYHKGNMCKTNGGENSMMMTIMMKLMIIQMKVTMVVEAAMLVMSTSAKTLHCQSGECQHLF